MSKNATKRTAKKQPTDQFRAGDVWKSPRGELHKVLRVSTSGVAYMINENTDCAAMRAYNDMGWGADRPWVLVSLGAAGES